MSVTFKAWDATLDPLVEARDYAGVRAARPADMDAVEANFHNQGAADTLRLLELPAEPMGRIPAADLPDVRRAIIRARNLDGRRAPFTFKPASERRAHYGGQSDSQILRRLNDLDAVVTHCLTHGWDLSWA